MLKPGDKAPAFRLLSDGGTSVALRDFKGQRALLFFFPKANTSGWIIEASEFRDAKKKFDRLNVAILGMSADSVQALAAFKQKRKLNFPLLSDPAHRTMAAYGSWQQKFFMGRKFMGIVRSSFLIGKTGKIEAVWPAVRAKGHASEILKHLQKG